MKKIFDWAFGVLACVGAVVGAGVFIWILSDLIRLGLPHISLTFLTAEVASTGREGGIGPILVSTLLILGSCLVAALPVAFSGAVWIYERGLSGHSRRGRIVVSLVDLLAGVPSIVFGLFGMVFFCQILGMGFSILSGGLTLAVMILPIVLKTTLAAMQSLPGTLRQGAMALGLSRCTTVCRVLLPAAAPGIAAGVSLGVVRALSETAALLFTSGYATRWPEGLMDSGRALSVHIFDLAFNVPGGAAPASASALVLIALLLLINSATHAITRRWTQKLAAV